MNEVGYYRTAQTRGEHAVLVLTIIALIVAVFFAFDQKFTLSGILQYLLILAVILGASLFLIRLLQHQFLGNMLKIEQGRFANIKDLAGVVASRLNMPEPDVFVTQNPLLNAYSMGFKQPYSVIFHSATVEFLDPEELAAVLSHEIGHIWFGHTKVLAYISPMGTRIPGLSWVFGFWSRRTELTCDRLALLLTRNPRAVIDMLIKVHIGPQFLAQLDAEGVLFQEHKVKGSMGLLAQSLSDHPFMTTRIKELLNFARSMQLEYVDKHGRHVCINCGLKLPPDFQGSNCPRCNVQLKYAQAAASAGQQPPEAPPHEVLKPPKPQGPLQAPALHQRRHQPSPTMQDIRRPDRPAHRRPPGDPPRLIQG
jgi:Zn-dependent protease with chaperone function